MAKENTLFCSTDIYDITYTPEITLPHPQGLVKISLVIEGSGILKIMDEVSECHAGDMYIIDKGVPHGYFAKSENESPAVLTVCFDPKDWFDGKHADFFDENFCYGVFRDKLPFSYAMLNSKALKEVTNIYGLIFDEIEQRGFEWKSAAGSYLTLLLITVARYIDMEDTVGIKRTKEWKIVFAAVRTVMERCGDSSMTLVSIASQLYISKSHLSRIFKKVMGQSFTDYVHKVRIERACNLLSTTNLTNEEIVVKCGLKDVPTFYRMFKSTTGKTPYQYRISRQKSKQVIKGEKIVSILNEISENLQKGKAKDVKDLVEQAIEEGVPTVEILNEGLLSGMNIIGEKFKKNDVYVPEVLVAARAMNMGMQILKPRLIEDGVQATGRVCIGTVQGDLHDIGKNLVKMMMEGKGLEVIDLGTDVSPETFVNTAIEKDCKVICCSALLTTTMGVMEEVVKYAESVGVRDKVKIMIGGAPITDDYRKQIGADCYTVDAASAADAATEFCK